MRLQLRSLTQSPPPYTVSLSLSLSLSLSFLSAEVLSLSLSHTYMMMASEDSVEDYWEDASVSWGCRGLSLSSLSHSPPSHRDGPLMSKQDFHITSTLRPRSFPPPITVCTTLSIKSGGRFVLKETASLPPHSFRVEREQGRLCLLLIEPKDSDSDEDDGYGDCNAADGSSCMQHHHQSDGYEPCVTETIDDNIMSDEQAKLALVQGMPQELVDEATHEETKDMPEMHVCMQEVSTSEKNAAKKIDSWDNSHGGGRIQSTMCANEIEGTAYMASLGIGQHRRWNDNGCNDIAVSLSPCSSKQVLSFARTSPPLGLAVS